MIPVRILLRRVLVFFLKILFNVFFHISSIVCSKTIIPKRKIPSHQIRFHTLMFSICQIVRINSSILIIVDESYLAKKP